MWHGGDEATRLVLRRGRGAPWIFLRTRSPDAATNLEASQIYRVSCPAPALRLASSNQIRLLWCRRGWGNRGGRRCCGGRRGEVRRWGRRAEVLWRQKRGGATVGLRQGRRGRGGCGIVEVCGNLRSLPMRGAGKTCAPKKMFLFLFLFSFLFIHFYYFFFYFILSFIFSFGILFSSSFILYYFSFFSSFIPFFIIFYFFL